MSQEINRYNLTDQYPTNIEVEVSDPKEMQATLVNYTVYKVKGKDKNGQFQCVRRYSQFDLIRQILLKRWPGCYIPALPQKKLIGNNELNFIQSRRDGLQIFCKQIAQLPHLWYSEQYQIFIRKEGNTLENLKALPKQSHEEIIKKYDEKFINIKGKSVDANLLAKFLEFSKCIKNVLPVLNDFKVFLSSFVEIQNSNHQQYLLLFNTLLPQYEKVCLTTFLDGKTEGKLIFSEQNDQKLLNYTKRIKQIMSVHNFDKLLKQIKHQQRQLLSFTQVYRQYQQTQKKIQQLKDRQLSLKQQQKNIAMGKQDLIKKLLKMDINENKKQIQQQLQKNKNYIIMYTLICDLIVVIMSLCQINRFKKFKINTHNSIFIQIAKIQIDVANLQKQMYSHILDNHNLM